MSQYCRTRGCVWHRTPLQRSWGRGSNSSSSVWVLTSLSLATRGWLVVIPRVLCVIVRSPPATLGAPAGLMARRATLIAPPITALAPWVPACLVPGIFSRLCRSRKIFWNCHSCGCKSACKSTPRTTRGCARSRRRFAMARRCRCRAPKGRARPLGVLATRGHHLVRDRAKCTGSGGARVGRTWEGREGGVPARGPRRGAKRRSAATVKASAQQ